MNDVYIGFKQPVIGLIAVNAQEIDSICAACQFELPWIMNASPSAEGG